MSRKSLVIITVSLLIFQQAYSQRNFEEYNLLGFNGGVTFFDLETANFETKQRTGFVGGLTTRGTFYGGFDLIFGINFVSNNVAILSRDTLNPNGNPLFIEYSIQGAQITFLTSYNVIRHHLTLEVGPILSINGKMAVKNDNYKEYVIEGYQALKASDIEQINKVNFHVMGGISTGIRNFRLGAYYQYGVSNTLNALNDKDIEKSRGAFKGNSTSFILLATIYL
jgi:hypothetical protein